MMISMLIHAFNDFHDSIDFTHTISSTSVDFLDLCIMNDSNHIVTSIHYKPTATHAFLHYSSNHPNHCKDSIPFSQFLRLRRICSDNDDFVVKCDEMCDFFAARGYPHNVVNRARSKASNIPREEALRPNSSNTGSRIPCVLDFNSLNTKIVSIVKSNYHIIADDEDVGRLFKDNLLISYRNERSLRKHLVSSKLNADCTLVGSFECNRNICVTCNYIVNLQSVHNNDSCFNIRSSFSCTSSGLVYCIICSKCNMLYIGETGRHLGDRFREHLGMVRNNRINVSDVAVHFTSSCSIDDMRVCGLYACDDSLKRKRMEKHIILKLGTLLPFGLNRED